MVTMMNRPSGASGGTGVEGGQRSGGAGVNVGEGERWLSALGGGLLVVGGLRSGSLAGWLMAGLGGALLYRGLSGHCDLYKTLGVNTARSN